MTNPIEQLNNIVVSIVEMHIMSNNEQLYNLAINVIDDSHKHKL